MFTGAAIMADNGMAALDDMLKADETDGAAMGTRNTGRHGKCEPSTSS
jgi:hypothetical protein